MRVPGLASCGGDRAGTAEIATCEGHLIIMKLIVMSLNHFSFKLIQLTLALKCLNFRVDVQNDIRFRYTV